MRTCWPQFWGRREAGSDEKCIGVQSDVMTFPPTFAEHNRALGRRSLHLGRVVDVIQPDAIDKRGLRPARELKRRRASHLHAQAAPGNDSVRWTACGGDAREVAPRSGSPKTSQHRTHDDYASSSKQQVLSGKQGPKSCRALL